MCIPCMSMDTYADWLKLFFKRYGKNWRLKSILIFLLFFIYSVDHSRGTTGQVDYNLFGER